MLPDAPHTTTPGTTNYDIMVMLFVLQRLCPKSQNMFKGAIVIKIIYGGEIALSSRQVGSKVGCDLRLANGDGRKEFLSTFAAAAPPLSTSPGSYRQSRESTAMVRPRSS
jgi:hypothetical protein